MPERAPIAAPNRQSDAPSNARSSPSSARGAPRSQPDSALRPSQSEHFSRYLHQLAVDAVQLSQRGDSAEQEADALAEKLMEATPATGAVAAGDGDEQALPHELKQSWQRTTGHDWSGVRLHTGPDAARFAESVHAKAATHGRDVYFARGRFTPQTRAGQRLIAHEAAHALLHAERPVVHREEESTPNAENVGDAVTHKARQLADQADDPNLVGTILVPFIRQGRYRVVSLTLGFVRSDQRRQLGEKIAAALTAEDLLNLQADARGKLILNELPGMSPEAPAQSVMPPQPAPQQAKKHHRHHHKSQQRAAEPASDAQSPDAQAPDTEAPDTETPDTEAPDTEAPDTEAPDTEAPEVHNTPEQTEKSGAPEPPSNDSAAPMPRAGSTDADAAVFNQAIEAIQHVKPVGNVSGLYTLSFQGRDVTLTEAQLSVLRGKVAESIRQGLMNLRTRVDAAIGYYHEQNNALHENPLFGSASRALAEGQDPFAQMMAAQDQIHQYEKAAYAGLLDPSHKLAEGAAAFENMEQAVNTFGQLVVYNTDRLAAGGKRGEDLAREVKGRAEFTLGLLSTLTGVGGALALAAPMLDVVAEQASRAAIGMDVQWMEAATDLVVQVILAWLGAKFPMKKLNVGPLSRNLRQLVIQAFKMLVNGGATVVEFRVQAMAQILLSSFPAAVRGQLTEKDKQDIWDRLEEAAKSTDFTDAILMSLAHETHAQFHPSEHAPERERKPAKERNAEPPEKKQPDGPESSPESAGGKAHSDAELVKALGPAAERVTFERVEPGKARPGDPVGRGVDVNFQFNKKTGLIEKITVRAGELATPEDIQRHLPAIRVCETFSGLHGRVRNLITRLSSAIGLKVKSTEEQLQHSISVEEVYKLGATIEGYRGEIEALQGPDTPEKQAQIALLEAHLESARQQLEKFEAIVAGKAELSSESYNKETGEGQISAKGVVAERALAVEVPSAVSSETDDSARQPLPNTPPAKKAAVGPAAKKVVDSSTTAPQDMNEPLTQSGNSGDQDSDAPAPVPSEAQLLQSTVEAPVNKSAASTPASETAGDAEAEPAPKPATASNTVDRQGAQTATRGNKPAATKAPVLAQNNDPTAVKESEDEHPTADRVDKAASPIPSSPATEPVAGVANPAERTARAAESARIPDENNANSAKDAAQGPLTRDEIIKKYVGQPFDPANPPPGYRAYVDKKGREHIQRLDADDLKSPELTVKQHIIQLATDDIDVHTKWGETEIRTPTSTDRPFIFLDRQTAAGARNAAGEAEAKAVAARDKAKQMAETERAAVRTAQTDEEAAAHLEKASQYDKDATKFDDQAKAAERESKDQANKVNAAGQKLGESAAIESVSDIPGAVPIFGVPSRGTKSGEFDQVWAAPGMAADGGELIIIPEAKGPAGQQSSRDYHGQQVEQGTREYLESTLDAMAKDNPDLVKRIRSALKRNAVWYGEVRALIRTRNGVQELGDIAITPYDISDTSPGAGAPR